MSTVAAKAPPKPQYPYRFNFLLALIAVVAVSGFVGWTYKLAVTGTRVETRTVKVDRPLTSANDLRKSLGAPTQSVPGSQMGVQLKTCDIWQGQADLTIVCHD